MKPNTDLILIIVGGVLGSAFMAFQLWTAVTRRTVRSATSRVLSRNDDTVDFWLYVGLAVIWFAMIAMVLVLTAIRLLR